MIYLVSIMFGSVHVYRIFPFDRSYCIVAGEDNTIGPSPALYALHLEAVQHVYFPSTLAFRAFPSVR